MPSAQRWYAQNRNALAAAVVEAVSAVRASDRLYTVSEPSEGSGAIRLTGNYTGAADATYTIELSGGGTTPAVSQPVAKQAGNATLVLGSASGANAEQFTVTLADLGTQTTTAQALVEGLPVKARAAGAGGNAISIEVDESGITATATGDRTLSQWDAATEYQTGEEWAVLGAYPLLQTGELHPSTPRVRIGADPAIFRPYQRLVDGELRTYLDPVPPRTLTAGQPVYTVSGSRTVTVTDGVTPEVLAGIVTRGDLFAALDATALVFVDGLFGNDMTPGGQGVREVGLHTTAYALAPVATGSAYLADGLEGLTVDPGAASERITVECTGNETLGAEQWRVSGTTSGTLGTATTGAQFSSAVLDFVIPRRLPAITEAPEGSVNVTTSYVARDTGEITPDICVQPIQLGARAAPGSITFTYRARPVTGCDCSNARPSGQFSAECLGVEVVNEEGAAVALDPELESRLQTLQNWRVAYLEGNLAVVDGGAEIAITADAGDIALLDALYDVFHAYLTDTDKAMYSTLALRGDWDARLAAMQAQVASLYATDETDGDKGDSLSSGSTGDLRASLANLWEQRLRKDLADEGIFPDFNGGASDTGACWTDLGDDHWWMTGAHLPAFTGHVWHSARKSDGGDIVSTQELALAINCSCPENLKEGDSVTVNILSVEGKAVAYQLGDKWDVPLLSASPVALTGGASGNDMHTYRVRGSINGAYPNYAVTHGAEAAYVQAGVPEFTIYRGGLPSALGDVWTFSTQTPQYRWSRNGGTPSAYADIPASGTAALDLGVSAEFTAGAAPAWPTSGTWEFQVEQSYAPANASTPDVEPWEWGSASAADLTWDLGTAQPIEAVGVLWHSLPVGAELTVSGGSTAAASDWSVVIPRRRNAMVGYPPANSTARYIKYAVTGAPDAAMRWLWAGVPLATTYSADVVRLEHVFTQQNSGGLYPVATHIGTGLGGEVAWTRDRRWLLPADADALVDMIVDAKERGNAPVALVPRHGYPEHATLCWIDTDRLSREDEYRFSPSDESQGLIAMSIPLLPVPLA